MMTVKRVTAKAPYTTEQAASTLGAAQVVLIWPHGVTMGRVAAAQCLHDGSAIDLVVEFEVPTPIVVPEDVCARVNSCRLDTKCAFFVPCVEDAVEHGDEQP